KGLCLDLSRPEGLEIALDLVERSDVVVEAFTPGVMARLGLGWNDCRRLNPKLVMRSISGFGQTGPNAGRPGYAHIAHSMTGWITSERLTRSRAISRPSAWEGSRHRPFFPPFCCTYMGPLRRCPPLHTRPPSPS